MLLKISSQPWQSKKGPLELVWQFNITSEVKGQMIKLSTNNYFLLHCYCHDNLTSGVFPLDLIKQI